MEKIKLTEVDISELPILSNEEIIKLFKTMDNGDEGAKSEIVNGSLHLVLSVLQRFRSSSHPIDDLFQAGCIGLEEAVDNFNIDKGIKLSTYAIPMILGEIKSYIRENRV